VKIPGDLFCVCTVQGREHSKVDDDTGFRMPGASVTETICVGDEDGKVGGDDAQHGK